MLLKLSTFFKRMRAYALFFLIVGIPSFASAHEVYVLDPGEFQRDVGIGSPNPFSAVARAGGEFVLWAFLCILIMVLVLFLSLTKVVEKGVDRPLAALKKYAPLAARLTFGTCLIASAYQGALFGPELPFSSLVGGYAGLLSLFLYVVGASILLGLFVRICSLAMLVVYGVAVVRYGFYMTTYANYLGEILINLILGAGVFSLDALYRKKKRKLFLHLEKYAFFLLRICFGVSIIFASYYAKFLHSQLAIDTVLEYHLTRYFHFEPLFIVLGAFIIEFLIGFFFLIGFEVRFVALVFLTFLALSLSYFGEAVWPHLVLIGVNIALFMHGYDEFTLEKLLFKQKGHLEPVL